MLYLWSGPTQCTKLAKNTGQRTPVNYDRESSGVLKVLILGSRDGDVNTVAANENPSLAGPPLALDKIVCSGTGPGGAAKK